MSPLLDPAAVHQVWVERILREEGWLPPIEKRLMWMGLHLPLHGRWGCIICDDSTGPTAFATRLYYGPWDRVVTRRAEAKWQ